MRLNLIMSQSKCNFLKHIARCDYEYRSIDGSCNNKRHPTYGRLNEPFTRLSPYNYDGLNDPNDENLPNVRTISNKIFHQPGPMPNQKCITNYAWLWGQFLDHTIVLTGGSGEPYDICIPEGDPHFDPDSTGTQKIHFTRTGFDPETGTNNIPREQINLLTPFIDGSSIYGSDSERNLFLRELCGGKMKESEGGMLPFTDGHYDNAGPSGKAIYLAGDVRCNEHIGLTAIHTLFVREHNYWAKQIAEKNPKLCDEEIYQRAKIIIEAELQAITFNEFLPTILGKHAVPKYSGYDSSVNPLLSNEFGTAVYRYGHSQVASNIYNDLDQQLKDTFFTPHIIGNNGGIDCILKSYAISKCDVVDARFINDLRNFLFGKPGQGGHDLAALNIQRGRDHGLSSYNGVREALGLPPVATLEDLDGRLVELYSSINDVELYVGGLIEQTMEGSLFGELFHKIIRDQFMRVRDGDRLWYENRFSKDEVRYINSIKLSDIIKRNTCAKVQCNVFRLASCTYNS